MTNDIIVFDGDCNFCNRYINFVIKHDHSNRFVFAPSGSAAGRALIKKSNLDPNCPDSIILICEGQVFTHSDAVLGIIKYLDNKLWLLGGFKIIPKRYRDFFYKWFAARRYMLFGKTTSCKIPSPEIMSRFLN
jgi:predicted DCC family thiol-disulfide oxidoreductase YuxK